MSRFANPVRDRRGVGQYFQSQDASFPIRKRELVRTDDAAERFAFTMIRIVLLIGWKGTFEQSIERVKRAGVGG